MPQTSCAKGNDFSGQNSENDGMKSSLYCLVSEEKAVEKVKWNSVAT